MALSNSYDFSLDRDGIIKEAYLMASAIAIGADPTADELTDGGRMLNLMLKAWQLEDIEIWLNQRITLFLGKETQSYLLGPTGGHAAPTSDVVKTEIATAADVTDSSIIVDSIEGIADGDQIGVELDNGTIKWTTVSGAPSGTTITLASMLFGTAAVDNHVYTYTSKIQRPIAIVEGRRISADRVDTPLLQVSRLEYMSLANKASSGIVNQFYYDPQITDGAIYVWPTCADVQDTLEFTIHKRIMDFDTSTDDGEFPIEWQDAIVNNLAIRIGIKLGIAPSKELKDLAEMGKFMAQTHDPDKTSTFFQPQGR